LNNYISSNHKKAKPTKKSWKKITKKKIAPTANKPKVPRKPRAPKETKDAENVLTTIPTREDINRLSMEELTALFARILESEQGLCREKEGFLERYYEHCEGLRHITAAKRIIKGEPPVEDTTYWASHPSRTWRTTGTNPPKQELPKT